jgi:hypothetical protein
MKHYYIILSGLFACVFCHVRAQEHRLLRDPYAYETAAEMYVGADTLPVDKTAARLAADISRHLEQGLMPEDDIIWDSLQKLEPYRKSWQVQEELKIWTKRIREAERSDSASASSTRHIDGNSLIPVLQAYHQGEFDKVIALSRDLLRLKMWEGAKQAIRNNLALALMHENRDLCAQMELELLNTNEIRYFPALINLTVVYERLGKREEAEVLVNRLTEYMKKEKLEMPLADFNAAWYQGEKGDHRSTDKALEMVSSDLMKKQQAPKYADYRKQLTAKYKSFSILKIGFLGKGFAGNDGRWVISFLVFFICWVVAAIWMSASLFDYLEDIFYFSSFLVTLLMLLYFIPIFILAWGIPSSAGGGIGLVLYEAGSWLFVWKVQNTY